MVSMERPSGFAGGINHYVAREAAASVRCALDKFKSVRGPVRSIGEQAISLTASDESREDGAEFKTTIDITRVWRSADGNVVRATGRATPFGTTASVHFSRNGNEEGEQVVFDIVDPTPRPESQ